MNPRIDMNVFSSDVMEDVFQQDLGANTERFDNLSIYLTRHKDNPNFMSVLEEFEESAMQVAQEWPLVTTHFFLDIRYTRRSDRFRNLKALFDSFQVIPLSTRLRETAGNMVETLRRNPKKSLLIFFFVFLIISGGIILVVLRDKLKPASAENKSNNTVTPEVSPSQTPEILPEGVTPLPPEIRSAYAYSAVINSTTGRMIDNIPNLFESEILKYNIATIKGHEYTHVYTYGGSVEIYPPINQENLKFYYDLGSLATASFCNSSTVGGYHVVTIVDGRISSPELRSFNELNSYDATLFANVIAKAIFQNDNCTVGVQFDIEPFDINATGQVNFFTSIAKVFASYDNNARNALFPAGRFFSIFTTASQVNEKMGEIFNQYHNGYIIDPLYDLGEMAPNSLSIYRQLAQREVNLMMNRSHAYNVSYQFAIPAAASAHEYEAVNDIPSGVKQIDYVKTALDVIEQSGARIDPLFKGISVWAYSNLIFFRNNGTMNIYTPNQPQPDTLDYLSQKL